MHFKKIEEFITEGKVTQASNWTPAQHKEWNDAKMQLLTEIDKVIKVKYFLDYGTLLGAIRESDFIKADNDIDLGIFAKDVDKDMEMRLEESPLLNVTSVNSFDNWYGAQVRLVGEDGKFVKVGTQVVFCDLYTYYPVEDYYVIKAGKTFCKSPGEYLNKLQRTTLRGKSFPCPSSPKKYLEFIYGEGWETPERGPASHNNMHTTFMKKLKKCSYNRGSNKCIIEYTKKHEEELKNESLKTKNNDKR